MRKPSAKQVLKWTQALRSGKYKQTTAALQDSEGYCCLGVACKEFVPHLKLNLKSGFIYGCFPNQQPNAPKWLQVVDDHFKSKTKNSLSYLNDSNGATFDEIADLLELVYVHKMLD